MDNKIDKDIRVGAVSKKVILLLVGGLSLGLTRRPDAYCRVLKSIRKEWRDINERSLRNAIKRLYKSKLISCAENDDGTVTLTLTEDGKRKALRYDIDKIVLKKPSRWDGLWRVVMFDIPESKKSSRDVLARKLVEIGFKPIQKSVFAYPHRCKDELDFIIEYFNLREYVRLMLVKSIDNELHIKKMFGLTKT